MRPSLRALALFVATAFGGGCLTSSPLGPTFASEPPGARVRVDGRDSGWVTPCQIALDLDKSHRVSIEFPGYVSRELLLVPDDHRSGVTWPLGVNGDNSAKFPLLLPFEDLFFPFRVVEALSPDRIFVRLRPQDDA